MEIRKYLKPRWGERSAMTRLWLDGTDIFRSISAPPRGFGLVARYDRAFSSPCSSRYLLTPLSIRLWYLIISTSCKSSHSPQYAYSRFFDRALCENRYPSNNIMLIQDKGLSRAHIESIGI